MVQLLTCLVQGRRIVVQSSGVAINWISCNSRVANCEGCVVTLRKFST